MMSTSLMSFSTLSSPLNSTSINICPFSSEKHSPAVAIIPLHYYRHSGPRIHHTQTGLVNCPTPWHNMKQAQYTPIHPELSCSPAHPKSFPWPHHMMPDLDSCFCMFYQFINCTVMWSIKERCTIDKMYCCYCNRWIYDGSLLSSLLCSTDDIILRNRLGFQTKGMRHCL